MFWKWISNHFHIVMLACLNTMCKVMLTWLSLLLPVVSYNNDCGHPDRRCHDDRHNNVSTTRLSIMATLMQLKRTR